ncbi:GNAT family N-acetyltransferase [uncultured Erythrobacter sp.]|uniref:GNAT family N-acetyltransferase n=1 Tax=uncultured Erythrobacter sp. TaxID=263913 RepID=UPI002622C7D4|nr:GNAT family N-acetyltransferase [uncultured Erythrobacter sp.]
MTDNEADKVTIRPAGPDDAVRLSLISDATFLETFAGEIAGDALVAHCKEMHAPRYLAKVLEEGAKAWLAELDHAPVGYALLTRSDLDAAQTGDIELKKIYLLSRFQGQGVASRLLDAVEQGATGYQRLLLGVKADNHRAIAFYTKQGFSQIDTRRFNVGGTLYDDIVLARDLNRN